MQKRIDRVNSLKVFGNKNIGLFLGWHDANDFRQTTLAGPVVGEWVLRSHAENVRRRGLSVGHVREQIR